MLGSPILYLRGMGILMFQLSGFHCTGLGLRDNRATGILCAFEVYIMDVGECTWDGLGFNLSMRKCRLHACCPRC